MDIIDFFRSIATANNYTFSHGNRANHNLLEADKDPGTIYFLVDPITESDDASEIGGAETTTIDGSFMLLIQSDMDQTYDTQKTNDKDKGKYEKNIKPLKTQVAIIRDAIDCSDYERDTWSRIAVTNILDTNMDGIVVTFKLKIDE